MGHPLMGIETPPSTSRTKPVNIQSPEKFTLSPAASDASACKLSEASDLNPLRIDNYTGSSVDSDDVIMQRIWDDLDTIKQCMPVDQAEQKYESDSDDVDDYYDLGHPRNNTAVMGFLPCGDIHVCRRGKLCPYLEPNDDRMMICKYTGIEHGPEHTEEFFDLNGGTGKKSGDPDQNCGEFLHGKWTRRADPVAASRMAFDFAEGSWDDTAFNSEHDRDSAMPVKRVQKRGARCVGEDPDDSTLSKRSRCSKKNVHCYETRNHLHAEAEGVITKMIDHKRASSFKNKAPHGKVERKCAPPDPRMRDEHFVFTKSVQKYVKNCIISGKAPSLDEIHNLSLMARTVSAKARQQQDQSLSTDNIRTAKFRTLCSSLIVSLWSAACSTPYMTAARKGTDAYRPFICGVLYAFKRGVTLEDGTVLVPRCPTLADALPVLRGTGGNKLAKTLHSSSHRGLCTLSRCIASVPKQEQPEAFANVARIASQFTSATFSKWDI